MTEEIGLSEYDRGNREEILQKYLNENPEVKKAVEEKDYLIKIFGYDFAGLRTSRMEERVDNQENFQDVDYNDGNWHTHPDPNISGVQIRHS